MGGSHLRNEIDRWGESEMKPGPDHAKALHKIRENLDSGTLPKDFDPGFFVVGAALDNLNCVGCGEVLRKHKSRAVAPTGSSHPISLFLPKLFAIVMEPISLC